MNNSRNKPVYYTVTYLVNYKHQNGHIINETTTFCIKTEIPTDKMTTDVADIIVRAVYDLSNGPIWKEIKTADRPITVLSVRNNVRMLPTDVYHTIRTTLHVNGRDYVYYMDARKAQNETVDIAFIQSADQTAAPAINIITVPKMITENDASGSNVKALLQQIMEDFMDITTKSIQSMSNGIVKTTENHLTDRYIKDRQRIFPDIPVDMRINPDIVGWDKIMQLPDSFLKRYGIRIRKLNVAQTIQVEPDDAAFEPMFSLSPAHGL